MKSETEWQTDIVKRIERTGGWARKWASPYVVGVPDILYSYRQTRRTPAALEVKREARWFRNTERTIRWTPAQREMAEDMSDAGFPYYLLIVAEYEKRKYFLSVRDMAGWNPKKELRMRRRDVLDGYSACRWDDTDAQFRFALLPFEHTEENL